MAIVAATSSGDIVSWVITDNEGRFMTLTATYFVTALPQVSFSGGPIDFSGLSELATLLQQLSVGTQFYAPAMLPAIPVAEESGGGSYTGPLDIVLGALVAYGQRALSSAMRGSALYTIRRSSDDTTQSFSSDATTGDAPSSSISSFVGVGNGFVTTWNDQSGNGSDAVQAAGANQPQWLGNQSLTGRPGVQFTVGGNSAVRLGTSTDVAFTGAITIFAVVFMPALIANTSFGVMGQGWNTLSGGSIFQYDISAGPLASSSFRDAAGNSNQATEGSIAGVSGSGTLVLLELMNDNLANAEFRLNGNDVTQPGSTFGFLGLSFPLAVGGVDVANPGTPGNLIFELLVWNGAESLLNRLAIRQNIAAYYGITLA